MTESPSAPTDATAKVQHQMTFAFSFSFLVGAGLTFVHAWLPVFAVLAYFVFGAFINRSQRNSERFADSLYYLGFLLTLVALLNATIGDKVSEKIIQNLGTGLSTTLAGLALRVFIIQFRGTVSDTEEETQESLAVETQRLISGLSQFTNQISELRKNFTEQAQFTTIALKGLVARLNAIDVPSNLFVAKVDAALAPVVASIASTASTVEDGRREIVESIRQFGVGIEVEGKKIIESLAHIPTKVDATMDVAVKNIVEKLNSVDFNAIATRQEKLLESFEAVIRSLASAAATCTELGKSAAEFSASAGKLETAVTATSKSAEVAAAAAKSIALIAPATTQMAEALRLLEELVQRAKDVAAGTERELSGISIEIGSLKRDLGGVRDATKALVDFATHDLKQ